MTLSPFVGVVESAGSARPTWMPPPTSAVPTGQAATALVTDAGVFGIGTLIAATRMWSTNGGGGTGITAAAGAAPAQRRTNAEIKAVTQRPTEVRETFRRPMSMHPVRTSEDAAGASQMRIATSKTHAPTDSRENAAG